MKKGPHLILLIAQGLLVCLAMACPSSAKINEHSNYDGNNCIVVAMPPDRLPFGAVVVRCNGDYFDNVSLPGAGFNPGHVGIVGPSLDGNHNCIYDCHNAWAGVGFYNDLYGFIAGPWEKNTGTDTTYWGAFKPAVEEKLDSSYLTYGEKAGEWAKEQCFSGNYQYFPLEPGKKPAFCTSFVAQCYQAAGVQGWDFPLYPELWTRYGNPIKTVVLRPFDPPFTIQVTNVYRDITADRNPLHIVKWKYEPAEFDPDNLHSLPDGLAVVKESNGGHLSIEIHPEMGDLEQKFQLKFMGSDHNGSYLVDYFTFDFMPCWE